MRRISIAVLALAVPITAVPPALAIDHLQTVNEVLLSTGGNSGAQAEAGRANGMARARTTMEMRRIGSSPCRAEPTS